MYSSQKVGRGRTRSDESAGSTCTVTFGSALAHFLSSQDGPSTPMMAICIRYIHVAAMPLSSLIPKKGVLIRGTLVTYFSASGFRFLCEKGKKCG